MTKQESIKYISSLINNPSSVVEGDRSSIALFRQRFPYFVPMRYLLALEDHKKQAWSPAMLSAMQPYMGNWMLFCQMLEDGSGIAQTDTETSELEPSVFVYEEETDIETEEAGEATEYNTEEYEATWLEEQETEEIAANAMTEEATTEEITIDEEEPESDEDEVFTEMDAEEPAEEDEEEPVEQEVTTNDEHIFAETETTNAATEEEPALEQLITPIHFQDYFLHQGERVSEDIPEEISELKYETPEEDEEKALMVMMSFSEWLLHFKNSTEKQTEEVKDRKALRTMWQKEKLAAAMEEENEEIPENVFEMAVNSITQEEGLGSETLAEIYIKQGKYDKAIEIYRKLSLRNPQKNVYFARKIDEVLKDKQS